MTVTRARRSARDVRIVSYSYLFILSPQEKEAVLAASLCFSVALFIIYLFPLLILKFP